MMEDVNDDLLGLKFFGSESKQSELVGQYCGNIEEQILMSHSKSEARRVADQACEKFDNECESEVVKTFLRQYIHRLMDKYWSMKP